MKRQRSGHIVNIASVAATVYGTAHALVFQVGPAPVLGDNPAALGLYHAVYAAVRPAMAPVVASLTPEGKALYERPA